MTTDTEVSQRAQAPAFAFYSLFVIFILLAPLYQGGDVPLPLLALQVVSIGFLLVTMWTHPAPLALPETLSFALSVLLLYPLLQLVPLPGFVWHSLPGRAQYAAVLERFVQSGLWRPISLVPAATEYGWLALLPPFACFLVVLKLTPARVTNLLLWIVGATVAMGIVGVLQVASGGKSMLYLAYEQPSAIAIGTFANRDHFAGILAMMLPVTVGLLVLRHGPVGGRRRQPAKSARGVFFEPRRFLIFAAAIAMLGCLLLTRSRVGIPAAFVGAASSTILLVRARALGHDVWSTRRAEVLVLGLTAIATIFAFGIGAVLERMEHATLGLDMGARLALLWATLRGAVEFLPFGSGLSTFAEVFPRFQAQGVAGYVDHAHNIYLQAFMELGVAALVILGPLLAAYGRRMGQLLREERGSSFTLVQLAAGIGMLPMILQSVFDNALHVPAHAMWFATLAGVLFHNGAAQRGLTES